MLLLKKLNLLIVVTLAIALCSCGSVQPLEVKSVEHFKVNNFENGKIALEIDVLVDNPNRFSVKVKDVIFDVKLSKLNLGEIKYLKPIKLKGNEKTKVTLDIETTLAKLLVQAPSAFTAFKKQKPVPLELNGSFKAGKLFIFKKYPVAYTDEILLNTDFSL